MKILGLLVVASTLVACASSGPAQIGKDTYMIAKRSTTYAFGSSGETKLDVIREGSAHCATMGKVFQLVGSNEKAAGWTNATADITYMCLSEGDPELARPKLAKAPDVVIEIKK